MFHHDGLRHRLSGIPQTGDRRREALVLLLRRGVAHDLQIWLLHNGGADRLPNILCAMVCFTELWSFCENAAYLSGSKLFLWLRQFTINKAKRWDEDVAKDMEDLIKK